MSNKDYTKRDNFRRDYMYTDHALIDQVLPDYFKADYPKLSKLLTAYYEFLDSSQSPAELVHDVILNRDISANDSDLLSFIEDELLLGQSYFEGFDNKRAAAKYSNTLYRSKGTLYSLQQFFRTFYGIAPEIKYTKEDVFKVGETSSKIGPESLKYITNDKLYQTYALLVKAELPISEWREAYKLFVHPAGMYVGGEVLLEGEVENVFGLSMPDVKRDSAVPIIQGEATLAFGTPITDLTGEIDSDGTKLRIGLPERIEAIQSVPLREIDRFFDNIEELAGVNSPTMDEDSTASDFRVPRFSNDRGAFVTMDAVNYVYYDSDSA